MELIHKKSFLLYVKRFISAVHTSDVFDVANNNDLYELIVGQVGRSQWHHQVSQSYQWAVGVGKHRYYNMILEHISHIIVQVETVWILSNSGPTCNTAIAASCLSMRLSLRSLLGHQWNMPVES